jgi:small subunit ribosomal protein S8
MTQNDPLASTLSKILNAEQRSVKELRIYPSSKIIKKVLELLKENMYLGECKELTDLKGNFLVLNLLGNINKCGAIKPRFSVKKDDFEKFEKRFLPAKDFGLIVVTTPKGIMTHAEAKKQGIGGRLLAYVY